MPNAQQLESIVNAAGILVQAGYALEAVVKALVSALHGDLSDADQNAICDQVIADAIRRKAIADADAAGDGKV